MQDRNTTELKSIIRQQIDKTRIVDNELLKLDFKKDLRVIDNSTSKHTLV